MTQLHQKPRSDLSLSDEWETPTELVKELSKRYGIKPKLDVASNGTNYKCRYWIDIDQDALSQDWKMDVWCNPPQSKAKEFVLKANEQWEKWNKNVLMILPANSVTAKYFEKVIDNVEIYPIFGRIRFLYKGNVSPFPARNGYFVVIWRRK